MLLLFDKTRHEHGLTLIELLLSVAIIGVLSAIAIPSYRGHLLKSQNATAVADIKVIQQCIERFYAEDFKYPMALTDMPNCLTNTGKDPWGHPYEYTNIVNGSPGYQSKRRQDKHLNPINTIYDLYSLGPDGVSKKQLDNKDSLDDIVLALDGAFVGISSDF